MLKQRIITALILVPVVVFLIFWSDGQLFALATGLIMLMAAWEWAGLSGLASMARWIYLVVFVVCLWVAQYFGSLLLAPMLVVGSLWWLLAYHWVGRYPLSVSLWRAPVRRALIGLLVLVPAWVAINELKLMSDGASMIMLLMLLIWGADTGAYFSGKAWGKHKLAPQVSPGKTREGVYGGLATGVVVGICAAVYFSLQGAPTTLVYLLPVLAAVTVLLSVLGDLLESMVKRESGLKDSGSLLPGHGGMMDRIDSMVAALPAYTLAISYMNGALS